MVEVSKERAAGYVAGTGILWGSLVEFGIVAMLNAWALGFVDVLYAVSDVQVGLLAGFGQFMASITNILTLGPARAVRMAWSAEVYEMFGIFAPLVVIAEVGLLIVAAYAAARRL